MERSSRRGQFYRNIERKIAQAQRRGHKRQAKRLHRTAARRRKDALHKFSRRMVDQYQHRRRLALHAAEVVPASNFPALRVFSTTAEALPEFLAAPHGDGTYRDIRSA